MTEASQPRPSSMARVAAAVRNGPRARKRNKGSALPAGLVSTVEQGAHATMVQQMTSGTPVTFSVVIPTYNRADVLPRALDSVLAQTLSPLEVIIVDDGSSDDTVSVLDALSDPRVRTIRQQNAGRSRARNHGAKVARGDVLTFLDDDDEADPEWLATLAQPFADDAAVALVSCGHRSRGSDGTLLQVRAPRDLGPAFGHLRAQFLPGMYAVKRDAFELTGGFANELSASEHTDLGMRLTDVLEQNAWRSASVEPPLVTMHYRPTGADRASNEPRNQYASATYFLEHHHSRLARHPQMLADYLAIAGVASMRLGRSGEARSFFAQAIRAHPRRIKHYGRLALALLSPIGRRVWKTGQPVTQPAN